MATAGHPIYFVPAFQDTTIIPSYFTTDFPTLNGAMNWNSWPFSSQGDIIVPTTDDQSYLTYAHASNKTFMMGVSPLQFKHIDSSQNWYRRGEQNLEYRFGQVLALQPDFVELQTWNDAGESHYMGNSWPEPIAGTVEGTYTGAYDHTGYQEILPAFIKAFKNGDETTANMFPTNGKEAQGVFWHHTLLADADCSPDLLGKPSGVQTVEDKVTVVVLVAEGVETYKVSVFEDTDVLLGEMALVGGYNSYSVEGLGEGIVVVSVSDTSTGVEVVKGTGPIVVSQVLREV
jgi:glucan endo-1,3-alpha-glucosidase